MVSDIFISVLNLNQPFGTSLFTKVIIKRRVREITISRITVFYGTWEVCWYTKLKSIIFSILPWKVQRGELSATGNEGSLEEGN